jgi:CarD family transcriptional regulator
MQEQGNLIVYENAGVCQIKGTEQLDRRHGAYYVLSPIYDRSSTLYVPVDGAPNRMRPVMSSGDALSLIERLPQVEVLHFSSLTEEKTQASEILTSGDQLRLAQLAKTIYQHQARRKKASKTTFTSDSTILRQAENLLFGELAVALDIDRTQVPSFIQQHLAGHS